MAILLLFLMVVGFMLAGVPIAVSLGLSSILFLMWHSEASLASVAQTLFNAFEGHYTLLAIPFFILASSFMSTVVWQNVLSALRLRWWVGSVVVWRSLQSSHV